MWIGGPERSVCLWLWAALMALNTEAQRHGALPSIRLSGVPVVPAGGCGGCGGCEVMQVLLTLLKVEDAFRHLGLFRQPASTAGAD